MAPPGRFKSNIVGTDLPLVGKGFEGSSKQISRKRRFGPPCRRSLNTPMIIEMNIRKINYRNAGELKVGATKNSKGNVEWKVE